MKKLGERVYVNTKKRRRRFEAQAADLLMGTGMVKDDRVMPGHTRNRLSLTCLCA